MSDELTAAQHDELVAALESLRDELRALMQSSREGAKPVDLDQPIGRHSRMDAIQQQQMTRASRQSFDLRLRQIDQALSLAARGEYGICRRCDEPIGYPRLSARPESPYCLECQDEIDHKVR